MLFCDPKYKKALVHNLRDFLLSLDNDEWDILIWNTSEKAYESKSNGDMSAVLGNIHEDDDKVKVKVSPFPFTNNVLRIRANEPK